MGSTELCIRGVFLRIAFLRSYHLRGLSPLSLSVDRAAEQREEKYEQ